MISREFIKKISAIPGGDQAKMCFKCAECTAVCPVARETKYEFKPHVMMGMINYGLKDLVLPYLWYCLTCGQCTVLCPQGINIQEVVRSARTQAVDIPYAHKGIFHSMHRIMARAKALDRTKWFEETGIDLNKKGDKLFFVSCIPLYEMFFMDLNFDAKEMVRSSVKILDKLNINYQIFADERCCGHDVFWAGDYKTFVEFANANTKVFKERGVKEIITFCPECYRTFLLDYPRVIKGFDIKVKHITEVIIEGINSGKIEVARSSEVLTYQDPCRLGRHCGVYDTPRIIMERLGKFVEMKNIREKAGCCGISAWLSCEPETKVYREQRLKEARETGAQTLVTACPHCLIHFSCSICEEQKIPVQHNIKVKDIVTLVGRQMK
ncbi:MAG: (Fe-S)-binding protein [Methanocellales archaeon]